MLPTPSTAHVDFSNVYEPSEDSYLLLDALSTPTEISFLSSRFSLPTPSPVVFEAGVGSGVVLSFIIANAFRLVRRPDVATIGSDINEFAVRDAVKTVDEAVKRGGSFEESKGTLLDIIQADLATPLRCHLIDILLFNPPYVPSEGVPNPPHATMDKTARGFTMLALATDGGVDGMEVTNRLLESLPNLLSLNGVAYLIAIASNKPEEIKARVQGLGDSWQAATVAKRRAGTENLQVLRIWRG